MFTATDKLAVRQLMSQRRLSLSPQEHLAASERICDTLHSLLRPYSTVALYVPLPGEVDIWPLAEHLMATGVELYLPRMLQKGLLDFARHLPGEVLDTVKFGVKQPRSSSPAILPRDLGVVVVPGLAFGRDGHRIGHGAGWYDRGLRVYLDHTHRVGVAYQFQVWDSLPSDPWDIPMDQVVTEVQVIRTSSGRSALSHRSIDGGE